MSDPETAVDRRAMALRGELVRALVEQAGPRPAGERLTVRLPTLLTVAALTAVGALAVGLIWSLVASGQSSATTTGSTTGGSPAPAGTVVTGWDCTTAADRGFAVQGRTTAWRTVATGGWSGDGCRGTFETMPMNGKSTDDIQQYAQWWFTPSPPVTQCDVDVYVPAGDSAADTAATAAHYAVLAGPDGAQTAEFVVDQSASRGRWATAGTFPTGGTGIAVRVTDRGVPAHTGDRIAVAQLRFDCSR